jgi:ankyrin repeat protein
VADVLLLRTVREADFTELSAVAVDRHGAVIVGGGLNVERPGEHSAFVRKLGAGGEPVWTTSFRGHAAVTGLAADPNGNVWVSGWFRGAIQAAPLALASRGTDRDAFIAKLSPAGPVLSLAQLGDGSYYAAAALALGRSGSPVVFGACKRDGSSDLCLDRLDGAGRTMDSSLLYVRGAFPGALAVDAKGGIAFAGHAPAQNADGSSFGGRHPSYSEALVGVCSPAGRPNWTMQLGGPWADTEAHAIACRPSHGDRVVVGAFSGSADFGDGELRSRGGTDIFVMKQGQGPAREWVRRFGDTGWDRANAVAYGPNGHIVFGGAFEDELGFADQAPVGLGGQDAFVAALSESGQPLWAVRFMTPGPDTVRALTVDARGHIWAVGTFSRPPRPPGPGDWTRAFVAEIAERSPGTPASSAVVARAPASVAVGLMAGIEPSTSSQAAPASPDQALERVASACERGDLVVLQRLVPSVVSPLARAPDGWSLLAKASYHGKGAVIRYLMKHGGDPSQGSTESYSPLKQAARSGHWDAVAALVEAGVDLNAGDGTDTGTALLVLLEWAQDDPALVRYLLEHGASPDCSNARGTTALMMAIQHGRERSFRELLSARPDLNAEDRDGNSVLAWAAIVGSVPAARELLARGAAADRPNSSRMTPLFHAAHARHLAIVQLLLSHGASPNPVEARYGDSALMRAANGGQADIVRVLVDRGAPINLANTEGLTALHMAARNGEDAVVVMLAERGADLKHVDRNGLTAEAWAARYGHVRTAALLGRLTAQHRPSAAPLGGGAR